jgi:hypothetical protein
MCLRVSFKKKYGKNYFFCFLKVTEEGVESGADPDQLVRGTDPGTRIRTPTLLFCFPNIQHFTSKFQLLGTLKFKAFSFKILKLFNPLQKISFSKILL